MDETKIIRKVREAREHVGNHLARLSARLEFPQGLHKVSVLALEGDELVRTRQRLVVPLDEFRFVIPRVNVAEGAGTKDYQNIFCLRREVRRARCVRILRRPRRANRFIRQQFLLSEQRQQRDCAQPCAAVAQEVPAVQHPVSGV